MATPDVDFPQVADVDAKLLKLAKERGMPILTTDFNLNRLAQIQDVQVLNVNDLANALKPAVLPGERLDVLLIKEGKESNQGVGYLDDGTMVVVERARERIGETLAGAGDLGAAAAVRQDHLHEDRRRRRLTLADLLTTWAIVVAAGDGRRLGADRPKAFVGLGDRLLLAHSVEMLDDHPAVDGIVLVVPEGWEEPATLLADDLVAGKVAAAVTGGATRARVGRGRAGRACRTTPT